MNDLEMMTLERTQDTVVFCYWMNITPHSHIVVFWGMWPHGTMYKDKSDFIQVEGKIEIST